ncbi:MAG TPA: hypothetical protein VLF61_04190 [Rhabdochlamydiaceae bacterium]|nr:hypothetical protein [Rhabdochlamydiaceae bacterium]
MAFLSVGFADETITKIPEEDIIVDIIPDNFYDPDKVVEGPIPHPSDVK